MKKIKILIIVFVLFFIANVKADMGPPMIVRHDVKVTNKNGAVCYDNSTGKYVKTSTVIPYGTILFIYDDIYDNYYISVSNEKNDAYNCTVKYSDISAVNQNFSLNNEDVEKLDSAKKAVILAKGGLNMRKGPDVTYGRIITIPEKAIVTITHRAGSYWYYAEYNGHKGWITGMDGYFGYEEKEILINSSAVKIYSTYDQKSVLGTIPANTEITNYITLVSRSSFEMQYYVVYNGIKGYIGEMYNKIDGPGKIKTLSDVYEYDDVVLKANQELEYTMVHGQNCFYFPTKKTDICITKELFKYIKEAKILTKTSGYIGEGFFGEAKTVKDDEPTTFEPSSETDEPPVIVEEKKDYTNYIIIGLLAGIFACLTALVIIKLVNSKKKTSVVKEAKKEVVKEAKKEEIKELPKEEPEIKVSDKEIAKAREEIINEMKKEQSGEEKNKE